jgi:hypothetical protein
MTPLDKKEAEKLEVQSRSLKEQFASVNVKERLNATFGGLETKSTWDWFWLKEYISTPCLGFNGAFVYFAKP